MEVYETMEGAETETGALKILLSNPTTTTGEFHDAFYSKKQEYFTFTFSSLDSPRVKKGYGEKIARKYGKDSNVYRVRVLGEFPKQEDNTVMGIDTIERSHERFLDMSKQEIAEVQSKGDVMSFGVDVARFGDDEAAIYARVDKTVFRERIIKKMDTMKLVGEIVHLRQTKYKGFEKAFYNIDLTGVGNGVVDRLNELITLGTLPADDVVIGVENNRRAINVVEYANIITQLWFEFGIMLKFGGKLEPDDLDEENNIQQQLCSRRYAFTSKGQHIIESKKILKKRLNGISPDRADGAILTIVDKVTNGNILYSDAVTSEAPETVSNENLQEKNKVFIQKTSMADRIKYFKK